MKAKNITPKDSRCIGLGCASLFETDKGTYVVVGAVPAGNNLPSNIRKTMGKGEIAIEVPKNLLLLK